ncbi:hydantoinase B/oxoprolinase family protein [Cryptosporangium sp. NPDC051539]|uniref:hydantoinase B/oxoprolinase family protein n=1 Tax=Cryptosporangium sp. NPDC051539 TaxID=3363962 RepID=UPI003798CDDD
MNPGNSAADGVMMALLSNRLNSVVTAMMNTVFRTGRSGVLNTAHDFSCCIVTANHELLIGANSLPIHMMSGPDIISRYIAQMHPTFARGDAYFHNSPYHGNSHAADHCLFVPVIDDEGVHRFSVLAKAHQADCGDSEPTTYMASAEDVYEEGALIFPAFKVQADYQDNEDFVRACQVRIRVPEQWWGDYLAVLGAVRVGERRLLEIGREVGWDVLERFTVNWFDYGERLMDQRLAELPSGTVTTESVHDPVPAAPDGIRIRTKVTVDSAVRRVEVDLRDNPDCLPNGLNLTEATSRTAAMIGVFNSIGGSVPANAGSFRRITVLLRQNCVAGIPIHPTSCSVATTNVADRVANAVQRAFADLDDGLGLAECGGVIPATSAVISGRMPGTGQPFVNQILLGVTGGAAAPSTDGWLTIGHVGNAGMLRIDSVELDEMRQPVFVAERRLLPDSEGAGRQRGAHSARVEYGPVGTAMVVTYGCDGADNPALGVRGGHSGGPSRHHLRRRDGEISELPSAAMLTLEDGERIISVTCGGGGYGRPADRDPLAVAHDVAEGWVSGERATDVYGVVLDSSGEVDDAATASRRADLRPTGNAGASA